MGLTERDAAVFADELGDRGAAIGLPGRLGGLPYDQLGVTGFGVAGAADAAGAAIGLPMAGATVAVQGSVRWDRRPRSASRTCEPSSRRCPQHAAQSSMRPDATSRGWRCCARSRAATARGSTAAWWTPKALEAPVQVLVPLLGRTRSADLARRTSAKLVVEGANLPTTPEALEVLHQRGVAVAPEFIANAGGIVAAAHSRDVRHSPFPADPARVFSMISTSMRANAGTVLTEGRRRGSPRILLPARSPRTGSARPRACAAGFSPDTESSGEDRHP